MAPKKKLKAVPFREWIDIITVNELAALLKIERATIRIWRQGRGLPRDDQKLAIAKLSGGAVMPNEMIHEHFAANNTGRKLS